MVPPLALSPTGPTFPPTLSLRFLPAHRPAERDEKRLLQRPSKPGHPRRRPVARAFKPAAVRVKLVATAGRASNQGTSSNTG